MLRVDDCMLLEYFPAASCIGCYNYVQCQAGPSALTAAASTATAAPWHFNFLELKGKWRKHHKPHAQCQWAAVRRTFKQRQWGHRDSAARGRGWPSPGAEAGWPTSTGPGRPQWPIGHPALTMAMMMWLQAQCQRAGQVPLRSSEQRTSGYKPCYSGPGRFQKLN